MKLNKKTLRNLSLAFFISGLVVAGTALFEDDSSAQIDSSQETANYQVAEDKEDEAAFMDTAEEDLDETASDDETSLDRDNEEDLDDEENEEDTDTSNPDDMTENETENDDSDTEDEETEITEDIIEVVVNQNEDSYSVVDKLDQAGIIEDTEEFNEFLRHYDYARRIQPGTKELSPAMSYEEIAQILTTY